MLDKLEKIFSIITGIISICIAIWVIFVGDSQFKTNLKISAEQLNLYKTERLQTVELGAPILAIATSGFTPVIEDNYYQFILKLQNYGERPAYDVAIDLYSIGYDKNDKFIILDRFNEISANPMIKNMQWDVGRNFSTPIKSKIYIYMNIEYQDIISKNTRKESYLLFIPERKYLNTKKEQGLINASLTEKDLIRNFIKNQ
jgi:hypothetical protein